MNRTPLVFRLTLATALLCAPVARAQVPAPPQPPAAPPAPAAPSAQPPPAPTPPRPPAPPQERGPRIALDVQVVIVRMQGDTVVSRLPYSLEVMTNAAESQLNMGSEVPVPTTTLTPARPAPRPATVPTPANPGAGQPAPPQAPALPEPPATLPQPVQSVSYRSVGTVISCRAFSVGEGQYELTLSVDDTSVLPRGDGPQAAAAPALPAFRSFRTRNTLLLRDGQSRTFTAASDRVSGEVVRVEVALRVVK